MILEFGGRNYTSFGDEFSVDFRVDAKAGDRNIFMNTPDGGYVNRVMGVFGANASGKTRLLKSLSFLIQFMTRSETPGNLRLREKHFLFRAEPETETDLHIEFICQDIHYRYELRFNPERVVWEKLSFKKARFNTLFEREWMDKSYSVKGQDTFKDVNRLADRPDASLIALGLQLGNPTSMVIRDYFSTYYGNQWKFGLREKHTNSEHNVYDTSEYFGTNETALNWLNTIITSFDLGLNSVIIQSFDVLNNGSLTYHPIASHRNDEGSYSMSLLFESTGTQALYILLRFIYPVLQSGGVAYIDEIESGLHSHVVPRIIDLFLSESHNPKGAQLIFTTHSDYVLTHLEKYQIQLVEKDDRLISTTYRLDDISGIKNVDNLHAKYHAGVYGAIPEM